MLKYITVIFFLIIQQSHAAETLEFQRHPTKIPSLGVKLNLFQDFVAEKREPVKTYYFHIKTSAGYEEKNAEAFKVNEIWLQDQLAMSYKSPLIDLKIYTPKTLKPKEQIFNKEFISAGSYRLHCKDFHIKTLKKDNLNLWLKDISPKITVSKFKRDKRILKHRAYYLVQNDKSKKMYLILNKNQHFIFEFKPKAKIRNLSHRINSFFSKLTISQSKDSNSSKFTNKKTKKSGERSSQYKATVEAVKAQVRGQEGWWFTETENYVFKSNLSSKKRRLAKNLQDRLEIMRKKLHKFIPAINDIDEVSVVTIIDNKQNYLNYVSDAPEWSAGLWHPQRREVILYVQADEEQTIQVLLHETFHQYIFYALARRTTPTWSNEGHAELVESSEISKSGFRAEVIEHKYNLQTLEKMIKSRSINIKRFINIPHQEFYKDPKRNYPIAWSLVYFLQKGNVAFPKKKYAKVCSTIYTELSKHGNPQKAVATAFKKIKLSEFQKDYYEFWQNKSLRKKAKRNKIFNVK